ncbi:MAG: hypothetical protein HC902_02765 [Calothrix sp. SM1_5_4]|nr:hypothetical protein [Calothrix sp. SM1_5_4]
MTVMLLVAALILAGVSLVLTLIRFARGPFSVDRIAVFELFMVILATSLMVLGLLYDMFLLVEIAGFTVVASFFGTATLASLIGEDAL